VSQSFGYIPKNGIAVSLRLVHTELCNCRILLMPLKDSQFAKSVMDGCGFFCIIHHKDFLQSLIMMPYVL
jgi:hypothetical protein